MNGLFEWRYQLVLKGRKKVVIKELKNPRLLIDYSKAIDDWWNIVKFRRV